MSAIATVPADVDLVPHLSGDAGSVETFASDLLSVAVTLDDLDSTAQASATYEGWEGDAATSYESYVLAAAEHAQAMSLALRAVVRAADEYGVELARLLDERDRLVEARLGFNGDCDVLRADLVGALPEDTAALQTRATELVMRRAGIVDDIGRLESDTEANESALRAVLHAHRDLETFLATPGAGVDPADAVMALPGAPGTGASPQEVSDWWDSLTPDQRWAVLTAHPDVIGAADGLPAAVRDEANRALLSADLDSLELLESQGRLPASERDALTNARAAMEALGNELEDPVTGEPVVPLLHVYDPRAWNGEGAVAIAYGDPDTADNVTTMVPGTTVKGESIPGDSGHARRVYESARLADPYATTATIMWIGYDTPEFTNGTVASQSMATAGGERLADYVDGLNAARRGNDVHMSVVGHSYGSTTVGISATENGLDVDDVILVGSPGAGRGTDHADDLGGPTVWVGNASRDPVAVLGDNGWVGLGNVGAGLGNDPAEDDFGANRFQAESVNRHDWLRNFDDHSRYYEDGSESLYNIGQIVVGDDDEVMRADPTYDPWYDSPRDPEIGRDPQQMPRNSEREPEW